jgi:hypothetical protein
MGLFSLVGGLIQKRPDVPEFKQVDAQAEQMKAIGGNQAALPGASKLAGDINAANQDMLLANLRKAIPNYDKTMQNTSQMVADFAAPGVPKDLQDLIQRKSAAKAIGGGFGGSQAHTNLELRDLGLTGIDLAGKKLAAAESWLGFARQNAMAPQFDVSSMFLSPQQQINLAVGERDKQFNRDWSNEVNRANNAWETILGKEMQNTEAQMMSMISSVAGSAGGAMMCWVAREVYGAENPKWLMFREWMLTKAPKWLLKGYVRFGKRIASLIQKVPILKLPIRIWMDSKIYGHS